MKIEKLVESVGSEFEGEVFEELLRRSRSRTERALKRIRRPEVAAGVVKSPLGDLFVVMSGRGIVLNHYLLGGSDLAAAIAKLRWRLDLVEDSRAIRKIGDEIRRYLGGEAKALRQSIDWTLSGSAFQKKVLRKLQEVPRGAVVSYQTLAFAVGSPNAGRAVGNALHHNPVPIYVPCHRVISANGRLGGYAGGPLRKLQLLRSEGFELKNADPRMPESVVWGHKGTKIFCRESCPTAARADRRRFLFFAGPEEARQAGMRACNICRPV